jgi:hypothetical protein
MRPKVRLFESESLGEDMVAEAAVGDAADEFSCVHGAEEARAAPFLELRRAESRRAVELRQDCYAVVDRVAFYS